MPFQIKDFRSITLSQINHARAATDKITDFIPGSVARTLMEAPAVEIEELYLQMFQGLLEAIPVATYLSFGFDRLPASRAIGVVSISAVEVRDFDMLIPAGSQFLATDGRIYQSTVNVTWVAGNQVVSVPVSYVTTGIVGNAGEGLIRSSNLFPASTFTISNSAITGGRDEETDAERMARFAEYIGALSRGTVAACMFTVRNTRILDSDGGIFEYVTRVGMVEEPGHVRMFIYSNIGAASDELLALAQARIDGSRDPLTGVITPGVRAAGVEVEVLRVTERPVSMGIKVGMLPGFTLSTAVRQRLTDIFATQVRAIQPGGVLQLGVMVEELLAATGVRAIVPTTGENFSCAADEALTPGTITIEAL